MKVKTNIPEENGQSAHARIDTFKLFLKTVLYANILTNNTTVTPRSTAMLLGALIAAPLQ